jgi:hypothetical protein
MGIVAQAERVHLETLEAQRLQRMMHSASDVEETRLHDQVSLAMTSPNNHIKRKRMTDDDLDDEPADVEDGETQDSVGNSTEFNGSSNHGYNFFSGDDDPDDDEDDVESGEEETGEDIEDVETDDFEKDTNVEEEQVDVADVHDDTGKHRAGGIVSGNEEEEKQFVDDALQFSSTTEVRSESDMPYVFECPRDESQLHEWISCYCKSSEDVCTLLYRIHRCNSTRVIRSTGIQNFYEMLLKRFMYLGDKLVDYKSADGLDLRKQVNAPMRQESLRKRGMRDHDTLCVALEGFTKLLRICLIGYGPP